MKQDKQFPQHFSDMDPEKTLIYTLGDIAQLRSKKLLQRKAKGSQHVIFYASGCRQGRDPLGEMIAQEDINGFAKSLHKVKGKSLTLILRTPGGDDAAVESISEYLHSEYDYIEVIVPACAMSGGAMIISASDRITTGKAGQPGHLDSQMSLSEFGKILAHDQRIGLEMLREMGPNVSTLESDQDLQNAVMAAYQLMKDMFESNKSLNKFIASNKNRIWVSTSNVEIEEEEDGE